jgi:hypothetical protein
MNATLQQRRTSANAGARVRTLTRALRTLTRCLVCGFREVRTDEVLERGILLLNECPRCDHRWTERPLAPAASAAPAQRGAPAAA